MDDLLHNPLLSKSPNIAADQVYTVTEYIALLNFRLKTLSATIQGEISEVKYTQKAVYFSLRDKSGSTIQCLIWLSRLTSLGVEPKDGLEVKVQGYPDVYPQYGKLNFKVDVITPVGEGALRLAFEKLKTELGAQGYFRPERKRPIPDYVHCVGLITSETGVVYRDFTRGLGNRGIKLYFYDARVEGSNAIESIVTGVQWFNQNTSDVEALVIARGGGSLEQLQPFNSIEVAKAIYGSRIPVMTAIGHETDVTIADLVADVRASVPMDAGKRLGAAWEKAEERIRAIEHNISAAFRSRCREFSSRLAHYSDSLVSSYAKQLSQNRKIIAAHRQSLLRCFRDIFAKVQTVEQTFNYNFQRFANALARRRRGIASIE